MGRQMRAATTSTNTMDVCLSKFNETWAAYLSRRKIFVDRQQYARIMQRTPESFAELQEALRIALADYEQSIHEVRAAYNELRYAVRALIQGKQL